MFFLAKVFACGEYVLGLVEAILDVFGSEPGKFWFSFSSLTTPLVHMLWFFLEYFHVSACSPLL